MSGKRIALSFVTCLMAASYLTPHAALAAKDPELSFYPAQKWNVENLTKAGEHGLKTCSVSNTFNNGFVVQFAGSSDGFINLNIDFRQPSFTQNKLYEVQYTIPGNKAQVLPTKAFKDSLLVTDLRQQKQFSEDLKASGVVDVKIQNNEFRLYLTGLEATMKDYNECVQPEASMIQASATPVAEQQKQKDTFVQDSMTPPLAAPARVIPETKLPESLAQDNLAPPPPMPAVIDLTQTNPENDGATSADDTKKSSLKPNFARERFTTKLAERMHQRATALAEKNKLSDMDSDSDTMGAETPPKANEKTVAKKGSSLETFPLKDSAPQKMAAEQAPAQYKFPLAEPVKTEQKTIHIEAQNEMAQIPEGRTKMGGAVINKAKAVHGEIDLTKIDTPVESAFEPTPMPQKSAVLPIEDVKEIAAVESIEPHAQQFADIEPSAGKATQQVDQNFVEMRNRVVDLERQLSSLQKENTDLDAELKSNLKDAADERTSISSNNWDLERATMRYNEAEIQINRLGRQLQSSKSQCDMEKSELKAMLFDPKLTDQQQLAKLSSLEEDLDRTKTDLNVQKRTYEERIRILEEQLNKQK